MTMKQAILFLSDKSDTRTMEQFHRLRAAGQAGRDDVFFLYHQQGKELPDAILGVPHYAFTSHILHDMGYTPIAGKLLPGSNHFPVIKFYLSHPGYDYYWLVEDDVDFSGDWRSFLSLFNTQESDFIANYIIRYAEDPGWYWWYTLHTGTEQVPDSGRLHAFNPIYRLSALALSYLHEALSQGWSGHHEVLMPTLLYLRGCNLMDMAGDGEFSVKDCPGGLCDADTFSYLPLPVQEERPNRLYHPVKEKHPPAGFGMKRCCVLSAVGAGSLHKEWLKGASRPDFDLHLIVYDQSFNAFYGDADFISYRKGYKLNLVYDYLRRHPEYLEHYDYFFLPDDDILTDAGHIARLFEAMEAYHLEIAQPALSASYYSHPHTLRDGFCLLRYTSFVEMMAPCFSRRALKAVLPTFKGDGSRWGVEYHWAKLIGSNRRDMAVIDQIPVVHTRPVQSFHEENFRQASEYIRENHLDRCIHEWGAVLRNATGDAFGDACSGWQRNFFRQLLAVAGNAARNMAELVGKETMPRLGLDGMAGCILYLAVQAKLSENKSNTDLSLHLLDDVAGRVSTLKDDMDFFTGLPGFCWSVEWLAQHGWIENNTGEILEEPHTHINHVLSGLVDTAPQDLLQGWVCYYRLLLANPANELATFHADSQRMLDCIVAELRKRYGCPPAPLEADPYALLFSTMAECLSAAASAACPWPDALRGAWLALREAWRGISSLR